MSHDVRVPGQRQYDPTVATGLGLAVAAQGGDADAFGELYRLYFDAVRLTILRRVDYDPCLAEDLTQQAFLDAWVCIRHAQFRSTNIRSWLIGIGCNRVRHHWGRLRATARLSSANELAILDALPQPVAVGRGEATGARRARRAVRRRIRKLRSPQQRRCLQLRYFEGMTQTETAAEMNRDPSTVRELEATACRNLAPPLAADLCASEHGLRRRVGAVGQ
jgi:RNA polymerase sigma-70 factor (ECF subfamily)